MLQRLVMSRKSTFLTKISGPIRSNNDLHCHSAARPSCPPCPPPPMPPRPCPPREEWSPHPHPEPPVVNPYPAHRGGKTLPQCGRQRRWKPYCRSFVYASPQVQWEDCPYRPRRRRRLLGEEVILKEAKPPFCSSFLGGVYLRERRPFLRCQLLGGAG